MSKIILKNASTPAPPTEGQVIIYAQDGVMRTWSHEGSPASLSTFSAKFDGYIEADTISIDDGEEISPLVPSEYYFRNVEWRGYLVYPLATDVIITSISMYINAKSRWNVPLSIRAYRGVSGEEPTNAGELIVLDALGDGDGDGEPKVLEPARIGKPIEYFGGIVTAANNLSVSLAGDSYMTLAAVPVTEDPGEVFISGAMTIVVTMSQA